MSQILKTSHGDLSVVWAREPLVDRFAERWPLPIATLLPREESGAEGNEGASFVVPFAYEGQHVNLVYLPQLPQALAQAEVRFVQTRALTGRILQAVAAAGYRGLFVPLATLRREGQVGVPGLAAVVGPEPEGSGPGGSARAEAPKPVEVMLGVLSAAIKDGFPFEASSRPKFVSSAVVGEAALDFGLCDGLPPLCFRSALDPSDSTFAGLAEQGLEAIVHFPVGSTRFPEPAPRVELGAPLGSPVDPEPREPDFGELDSGELDSGGPEPGGSVRLQEPALDVSVAHSAERARISSNGARRIFRVLCLVAACDGHVDPSERELLDDYVDRFGIAPAEAAELEAEGRAAKRLAVGKNPLERELMFQLMVDVAAADGELHRAEQKRLVAFADTLEIPREELRRRLDERFAAGADPKPPQGGASDSQFGVTAGGSLRASAKGLRRIYRVLWYLANSEGDIGPEEDALLDGYRRRYGISPVEAGQLRREGMRGKGIEISKSPQERGFLLEELVAVAVADGEITEPERRRLEKLALLLRVPLDELQRLLRVRLSEGGQELPQAPAPTPAAGGPALGTLVVLNVSEGLLGLNLAQVPVSASFRGFASVPPGVHRLSIPGTQQDSVRWIKLEPGEVVVLTCEGGGLADPSAQVRRAAEEQALAGRLDAALEPFVYQRAWERLTEPLLHASFPPPSFRPPSSRPPSSPGAEAPSGSRLEQACREHKGQGASLLAELAFSFLRGFLDEDAQAFERYQHLVQAFYHCGEGLPREDPQTFEWVPHLLMAQQRQLPPEALGRDSPLVFGSHYLSEDLIDTDVDELVEAGRRWAVFIAGRHVGAPAAQGIPASMKDVAIPGAFEADLQEATDQIRTIEYAKGRDSRLLLPHFACVSRIREASQDWLGAAVAQSRLVEVGEAVKVSPGKLAQGYGRLARLQRECGRAQEAAVAEARSQKLALKAARRSQP